MLILRSKLDKGLFINKQLNNPLIFQKFTKIILKQNYITKDSKLLRKHLTEANK